MRYGGQRPQFFLKYSVTRPVAIPQLYVICYYLSTNILAAVQKSTRIHHKPEKHYP